MSSTQAYYPASRRTYGGLSIWRGKFNETTGKVVYDKDAKSGTIEVTVNVSSIDFGNAKLDEHAKSPNIRRGQISDGDLFGKIHQIRRRRPNGSRRTFTLHGVSKPLTLKIDSFLCKPNPMTHKEVCGADATASFDRPTMESITVKRMGSRCG